MKKQDRVTYEDLPMYVHYEYVGTIHLLTPIFKLLPGELSELCYMLPPLSSLYTAIAVPCFFALRHCHPYTLVCFTTFKLVVSSGSSVCEICMHYPA